MDRGEARRRDWSLISTHGIVVVFVAAHPTATLREIAQAAGVTERQVARVVKELADAGLLRMERQGRRNTYAINQDAFLRRPLLAHIKLERLISAVQPERDTAPPGSLHA
jgi:DNA-binding transcriptional regulator GbsR (MarR family)